MAIEQQRSAKRMCLYVKTLTGETITLDVEQSAAVERVKLQIQDREDLPPDQQNLLFAGRPMEDGRTLADYSVTPNSSLYLVVHPRQDHPTPVVSVSCSDAVPNIGSAFRVIFGRLPLLSCAPSDALHVSCLRRGEQQEKPLAGKVRLHYRLDDGHRLRGDLEEDLRLTFVPSREEGKAFGPGDVVCLRLVPQHFDFSGQPATGGAWLPSQTFRFCIASSSPLSRLSIRFVGQPSTAVNFTLRLERLARDLLSELAMAIAVRAGVSLQAIASLACHGVKLKTRYEVAQLREGDVIEVTLHPDAVPKGGCRVPAPGRAAASV